MFGTCLLEDSKVLQDQALLPKFCEISIQIIYQISASCAGFQLRLGTAFLISLYKSPVPSNLRLPFFSLFALYSFGCFILPGIFFVFFEIGFLFAAEAALELSL